MKNAHAVVIGSGMAGLLTARVLSEHFDRVTVIERDALPTQPRGRRGVPQGNHVHGFQARGVQIVDKLFPGLLDEMVAAGARRIDNLADLHFSISGHLLCRRPQPITPVLTASRPFLEQSIRGRVAALPAVIARENTEVLRLLTSGESVTGVMLRSADGAEEALAADLVVDATGRGSRTPAWLEQLGYSRPDEDRIAVRVKYVSQTLRRVPADQPARFVIDGRAPGRDVGVALFTTEHNTWVFTVMGAERAFGPNSREWMLRAAQGVLPEWAQQTVSAAEPVGPVTAHGHPASIRRRYDRVSRFPAGLVVLGDALCAFNPIYGQGMSVAAYQAVTLGELLTAGSDDLGRRFFAATSELTTHVWEMAAGSDLAYPEVEGNPTLRMRLIGRYLEAVLRVAEHNPQVAERFMAVSGLVAPRTALFGRDVLLPVLRSAWPSYRWLGVTKPGRSLAGTARALVELRR